MDLVSFEPAISIEAILEGKFGRQREAMDVVTFELGTTTATRLGGNGRHWIW